MTTNFNQNSFDLDLYLIPISNKDVVPLDKRKMGTLWGTWGSLWSWGSNAYGQLGLGNTTPRSSPVQVGSLTNWKLVTCCRYNTLSIKNDGTLWVCGSGTAGELGLNNASLKYSSPVQVGSLTNWKTIAGGSAASLAVKTDGTLWSWGSNYNGTLGLGDTTPRSSPVQVGSLTNWSSVDIAYTHATAIKTDGTIWSWGSNVYGQLGQNDRTHRSSPVQVGSLTNWKSVSNSRYHSAAIKTDGTLWIWGRNTDGQLGLNDLTHRSSPVQVGSLTNWKTVSCSPESTTIAIKTDGTLWAWGYNVDGQLGIGTNGTLSRQSSPVQVGTLTNWSSGVSPSHGYNTSAAIKTDGTLWMWGWNSAGELGLNDRTHRSSPVQVGSLTNWISVAVSRGPTIAIQTG